MTPRVYEKKSDKYRVFRQRRKTAILTAHDQLITAARVIETLLGVMHKPMPEEYRAEFAKHIVICENAAKSLAKNDPSDAVYHFENKPIEFEALFEGPGGPWREMRNRFLKIETPDEIICQLNKEDMRDLAWMTDGVRVRLSR